MNTRSRAGYIMAEIIVAIVVLGIALIPFLRSMWLLPQVGNGIHAQSRTEAWRTLTDRAVTSGIDPSSVPVLGQLLPTTASEPMGLEVSRANETPRVGAPQISALLGRYATAAEPRAVGQGFEIGPSSLSFPPRTDPLPPLPPIVAGAPSLTPANGSFIPVSSLAAPAAVGAPFVTQITATASDPANRVFLQKTAPSVQSSDAPAATSLTIDAVELARAVRGRTWAEYQGNPASDTAVPLGDGRTRWLVPVGSRLQDYEPSDFVGYVYGVDIGRPVYSFGGAAYASGADIPVNIAQSKAVESGATNAVIGYPASVVGAFGSQWASIAPSFTWSLGSFSGDSSAGNTRSYFTSLMRPFWSATQTLTATPVTSFTGLRSLTATWTIDRSSLALSPPERTTSYFDASTDQVSQIDYTAPILPATGTRVGRPKVNGVESAGDTVSSPLIP